MSETMQGVKTVEHRYSVFVGGAEVNDFYLTLPEAKRLAQEYADDGYDQVVIVSIHGEETIVKE